MAQVGATIVGLSPLGSGAPSLPEGRDYPSTGAWTLGSGVGTAGGAGSDLAGPDFSGVVQQFIRDANTGAPFYLNYPITGGSITEDIDSIPYATGSIESDGLTQLDYNLLAQGVTGFVGTELQVTVVARLGSASDNRESSANLGRFLVEELRRVAEPGKFGASFRVTSKALSNLGTNVSGDLTGQAMDTAGTLGLMADGRASIEGIAAWIIDRAGHPVSLSEGFLAAHVPTPAFQLSTAGAYIGPYSVETRAAADVLKQALKDSGCYLRCRTDGSVVLTPRPDGIHAPPSLTAVRSYGYGLYDHPFAYLHPSPLAKPSSVSVIQQSTLGPSRIVTVAIGNGLGTGAPMYFSVFRPLSTDPDDHQTYRANQLAATFVMRGEQVEIGVLADGSVHAGDSVLIDGSSHGISPGLFLCTRATHPLGPVSFVGQLTCQRLAYTWT